MEKKKGPVDSLEWTEAFHEIFCCILPVKRKMYSEFTISHFKDLASAGADGFPRDEFARFLMKAYFILPDSKEVTDKSPDSKRVFETKKMILDEAVQLWKTEPNEESNQAFRFLIAAHSPLLSQFSRNEWESDYEMLARGRAVSKEEKERVEAVVRENVRYWCIENLEVWIQQCFVPEEFLNIMILARARKGKRDLVLSDIANTKFLEPFGTEKRSDAAKNLLKRKMQEIAGLDEFVSSLRDDLEEIRRGTENLREDEDELVFKEVVLEYEKKFEKIFDSYPSGTVVPLFIRVVLNLKASITCEDQEEIFADTRTCIVNWKGKNNKNNWSVALWVGLEGSSIPSEVIL